MRLKSLELQGFKSFPDKTKINIEGGMTVIVGPNGSGKSNISDAIRWVLGEISSKNIRGNKMEDVIFGGTDSRRPMGFAQVSLTFDNSDAESPLPLDYDEVTVTRKYFRAGYSEYYIGGKPVRLRDITEMFMNTGLGKSGYSIIGQGRIAEIISKKSEDRRGIFEEAAGISKYRYKKSDAEKKLTETEDNLNRVTDILSELESRVGPLEKDSIKAKKYLELYDQKKKADVSLWMYEIDHILEQSEKLQSDYEIAKHSLEMADDSLSGLESQSEKLNTTLRENREKAEVLRLTLTDATERRHEVESDELLLRKDLEHFSEENTRLKLQIAAKEKEGAAAAEELDKLTEALKGNEEKQAAIMLETDGNAASIDGLRALLKDDDDESDACRDLIAKRSETLVNTRMELSTLEGSGENAAARREELTADAEDLTNRMKLTGERCIKAEKTVAEYDTKISQIEANDSVFLAKIESENGKKKDLVIRLDDEKVACAAAEKRMEVLQRMEEHFEGYASSVRVVMERSAAGRLSGICGPVSQIISSEESYAVAIETVLGGNIQNIIVETESDAKAAISLLKNEKAGRATFYPLDIMQPDPLKIDYDLLSKQQGFIGMANDLVNCDNRFRPVIDYLLCRSAVCRDLDAASRIAREFGYQFRLVTLDGQVINAGGSYTGGSAKRDSGMLSRSSEIKKLQKDIETSAKNQKKLREEISAADKRMEALEGERGSESASLDMLKIMRGAEDTQLKILQSQIESDKEQLQKTAELLESLDRQDEEFLQKKADIEGRIAEGEKLLKEAEESLAACEENAKNHQAELDKLIEEKNAILLRQTAAVKDTELSKRDQTAMMERIAAIAAEKQVLEEDLQKLAARSERTEANAQSSKDYLTQLAERIEKMTAEVAGLQSDAKGLEEKLETLRLQSKEKSHDREIFFRDFTKLEAQLGGITQEQDKYTARLWDEYELTYSAAKELDYPRLTAETRTPVLSEQTKLRGQIRALGNVNVGAIEEYKEVKERYDFLSGQYKDLTTSREELTSIIFQLEKEMRIRFEDTFAAVNDNFKIVFKELFGGGTAQLLLTDPDHPLECGIEINVAPPGKIIKSLTLLSGGEQVFVAIALFFAILKVAPAPFCLLDEIEAALDEVNVSRFATYAKRFSDKTQFIIITHRRGTMEEADALYGVTMQERGISKVLSLNVNEVEAKLGEKPV